MAEELSGRRARGADEEETFGPEGMESAQGGGEGESARDCPSSSGAFSEAAGREDYG